MLLSFVQLRQLVERKWITNVSPELINGSSIDITLGRTLLIEKFSPSTVSQPLYLSRKDELPHHKINMDDDGFPLRPGDFVLAHSEQIFSLPLYISAEYKLKSSMARMGINHLNAGWCDPGWHGSALTLELVNCSRYHTVVIKPGDRIGQMVFFQHTYVPEEHSYRKRGRYNGDTSVSGVKKDQ